jgi:hypothetical protein
MTARRFPPPWSVEELDACFVARDHNGQQLAYVYFEDEPGRRSNNSSRVGGSDPQRESILIYRRNNSGSLANPPRLLFGEQPPSNVLLIRGGAEQPAEPHHCGSALSRVKLASFAT